VSWPRTRLAAALVVAALALAACDDDEGGDVTATTTPAGGDDTRRVLIQAEDGAFDPRAVYEAAAPGVVTIRSTFASNDLDILGPQQGQGSGFVLNDEGEIVTNAHVVTDAGGSATTQPINEAREVYVEFPDRNQVAAEVVGFDPHADVALLRVDPEGLDLSPVALGSSEDLEVGDPVAAIGSPFGEEQSLSVGVVSATDRSIPSLTRFTIDGAIQTDASINPGNSGGPLLDSEGRVIGINQQIDTTSGGFQGVGFAVPIDLVKRSVEQLRADGEVDYAYLGVSTAALYPQLAEELELPTDNGVLVQRLLAENGPAEEAGIRGGDQAITFQGRPIRVGGDVIVAVDGQELVGENDLASIVSLLDPGQEVSVEIIRDGERQELQVTLGERSE
jgi:S1-C subfamily serine protease